MAKSFLSVAVVLVTKLGAAWGVTINPVTPCIDFYFTFVNFLVISFQRILIPGFLSQAKVSVT